jgi:hypothetical protein
MSLAAAFRGDRLNAIHFESTFKFDFSRPPGRGLLRPSWRAGILNFRRARFGKDRVFCLQSRGHRRSKLAWFRQGGEVSEAQWRDILGGLSVQSTHLDLNYMRDWAARLCVFDLLERALLDAGTQNSAG